MASIKRKPRGFCYDKDKFVIDRFVEFVDGRRRRLKKRQTDLGNALGITQQAFSHRMEGAKFELLDLVKLFEELEATDEEILRIMKSE